VYSLNDQPLPLDHGYPVRCLFPGRCGQKQPKWLSRITVQTERHEGHWEGQGWSDEARVKINSRIDRPSAGATVPSPVAVDGIAFSGLAGVAGVDVLIDDRSAGTAELLRAPEPFARTVWTEWSWSGPIVAGAHSATARATDGAGAEQRRAREALLEGTKPDGTSEMHRVRFTAGETEPGGGGG
jgi:sulfite oxidase